MARERMVTRTVMLTECEVMCLNIETAEVSINSYAVTGSFDDTNTLLDSVKKSYETDSLKCVTIHSKAEKEVLYGIPEKDFIKLAKILPPRSSKEK